MKLNKVLQNQLNYLASMYERIIGRDIAEFYNSIKSLKNNPDSLDLEERKFVDTAVKFMESKGLTYEDILSNKDLFMSGDVKKQEGSFFTPLRWAKQAHNLVVNSVGIENLKDYVVWDTSCGTGNLLIEFPTCKHIYLSTLNQEDIPIVEERFSKREDKQPFTAFQLDFLNSIDTVFSPSLTSQLPEGLQDVLKNNGKLAIIINPPYSIRGLDTCVGEHLTSINKPDFRLDLYHQFVWQVYNLVDYWGLTDFEFVLMTQGGLHINRTAECVLKLMNERTNYTDGFLYPASDFMGVSGDHVWAISTTHWFRRSGVPLTPVDTLKLRVLETKEGTDIEDSSADNIRYLGDTYFSVDAVKHFKNWVKSDSNQSKPTKAYRVGLYGDNVVIDKQGKNVLVGIADHTDKTDPVFGYSDVRSNLRSSPRYSMLSTLPNDVSNTVIRQSNFNRVVFYLNYPMKLKTWRDDAFQRLIAPIEDDYYLNVYYPNALINLLVSRRNFNYVLRSLPTPAGLYTVNSPLFILTDDEVLDAINLNTDEVSRQALLRDFEVNGVDNSYILAEIQKTLSNPNLNEDIRKSFDTMREILKYYLTHRRIRDGYPLDCAYNLNYSQLKQLSYFLDSHENEYAKDLVKNWSVIEELNRGISFNYGDSHAND